MNLYINYFLRHLYPQYLQVLQKTYRRVNLRPVLLKHLTFCIVIVSLRRGWTGPASKGKLASATESRQGMCVCLRQEFAQMLQSDAHSVHFSCCTSSAHLPCNFAFLFQRQYNVKVRCIVKRFQVKTKQIMIRLVWSFYFKFVCSYCLSVSMLSFNASASLRFHVLFTILV